ncbi:MAG TPA: hypothetical protein VH331_17985 [Allosphingosinicella sp.]|nr:hypothetical protein [Allosphingosinicella sp.]
MNRGARTWAELQELLYPEEAEILRNRSAPSGRIAPEILKLVKLLAEAHAEEDWNKVAAFRRKQRWQRRSFTPCDPGSA